MVLKSTLKKFITFSSIGAICLTNAADVYMTYSFYQTGLMTELNPLVLHFLNHSIYATLLYKVLCTAPICFLIYFLQNTKYYKSLTFFSLFVCFLLSLWWVQYLENEVKYLTQMDINYLMKTEEIRNSNPFDY
jgi:hypothetical protein